MDRRRGDVVCALAETCIRENVGVVTYFSLAAGFLTGKYRSEAEFTKSVRGPGMKKYRDSRGLRIVDALGQVGGALGAHPAQVALAWLMQRPGVTAPIASATSVEQLRELIGAMALRLDDGSIGRLDDASG